jgi:hypothetical protein
MKLKKERQQGKCKQRGKIETSAHTGSTPLPHKSSSSTQRSQELNVSKGESNEICVGGGDGDDPLISIWRKLILLDRQRGKGVIATKVLRTLKSQKMI